MTPTEKVKILCCALVEIHSLGQGEMEDRDYTQNARDIAAEALDRVSR